MLKLRQSLKMTLQQRLKLALRPSSGPILQHR
jgi:hypothetical protein